MLAETVSGNTPTPSDVQDWAAEYDIHHPVVADPGWGVTFRFASGSISLPSMHQLGEGAEVLQVMTYIDESEVVAALP